jgi:RimJ/RimL family protein N-acetyltransferase
MLIFISSLFELTLLNHKFVYYSDGKNLYSKQFFNRETQDFIQWHLTSTKQEPYNYNNHAWKPIIIVEILHTVVVVGTIGVVELYWSIGWWIIRTCLCVGAKSPNLQNGNHLGMAK